MNKKIKKLSFIDTKYTLAFAVRFSGFALFGFIVFGFALFIMLNRRMGISYFEDISILTNLQEKLPDILLATGIVQAIVWSFVLFVLSLFWTHAVTGPLVRYRRYLGMIMKAEDADEIVFREKDQLHCLAESFRRMQTASKVRHDKFTFYLNKSDKLVAEYEELLGQKSGKEEQLQKIRQALKKIYKNMKVLFGEEENG